MEPQVAQLIESLPQATALLDEKGRLLCVNEAWGDAARPGGLMDVNDARGRDHIHDLENRGFALESGRELAKGLRAILDGHQKKCVVMYEIEDHAYEAFATTFDVEPAAIMIQHMDRSAETDASELQASLDEAEFALQALKAWRSDHLNQLELTFQATHGPMTPIRIRLHQLLKEALGPLTKRQREAIEQIERNVDQWWSLEEKMRGQWGAAETKEAVPIADLLAEVLRPVKEMALRAGVPLDVEGADTPGDVMVAPATIRQVMMTILEHAVRRTPVEQHVRVHLRASEDMVLEVEDRDPSPLKSWPGLRFAQAAVKDQGGSLTVEQARQGVAVKLRLPRA